LLTAYVMAIVTAPQARAQIPQAATLWTHFVEPMEPAHGYAADLAARFLCQGPGVDLSGTLATSFATATD